MPAVVGTPFAVFIGLTVVIMGGAGYLTGQAYAASWRPAWRVLPPFLLAEGAVGDAAQVVDGLALTGYFLERHVFHPHSKGLPQARQHLLRYLGPAKSGSPEAATATRGPTD